MAPPGAGRIVAVVGAGDANPSLMARAEEVGRRLAGRGATLVCGGLGGVMEAAAKGARETGGRVVGVLPTRSADDANPYVDVPIATGLGEARNAVIATACDAMIAVGGEYGTLSEVALALKMGKRVVSIASRWAEIAGVEAAETAEEAVARALEP